MEGTLALADSAAWARSQFAAAPLGDRRRTRRLVRLATMMAGNTNGSIPQQTGGGADMKAAYRLFDADDVTHAAVCQPHFDQTRAAAGALPMVFLLQDTTTLDFTTHRACRGLGPIGQSGGRRGEQLGLHQHNVLAIDPTTRRPLGLMHQRHHRRTQRPQASRGKRHHQRAVPLEERESYWWIAAIAAIGRPPAQVRWVHVGDRGEDLFGVYDEARRQGADWLIRVVHDRRIFTPAGEEERLLSHVQRLPVRTRKTILVRRVPTKSPQEVTVCISGGAVSLRPSRSEPCYAGCEAVGCWAVRVWEEHPPAGSAPLEWVLCTSLDCDADPMLAFAAEGYGLRWMIEEFHKCEKTGCQVESRRLEDTDRLEPLIGLLSVLSVALLQLKFVARDEPDAKADTMFDPAMVRVMARHLGREARDLTVRDFWRGIGRLGGHPGRKIDGEIGWLRAWRGWQNFQWIMLGADLSSG